jgi:ABC-type branched-subunit amino acid transport system substrate-binding protein
MRKSPKRLAAAALAVVALVGAACSSSSSSSSTTSGGGGATGTPYKLALVSSITGTAAPQFGDTAEGFNAAISQINAAGGAGGHKLVGTVYDDATSPTQVTTVVQKAISDGNQMIIAVSPLFFLAAKFPQQAGIPVVGGGFDGFEWGTPGYENMFASDVGSNDPNNPPSTGVGLFMKHQGATVVCAWGYGISPSSAQAANNVVWSGLAAGLKKGVLDTSIPFGAVDMTTPALAAKQANCNGIETTTDVNTSVALTAALKNEGQAVKANIFAAGLDPTLVNGTSWDTIQGAFFSTGFRPVSIPDAATNTMQDSLLKYVGRPKSKFPTYNIYESYLAVELAAEGVGKATSTSSAAVIKALRGITNWNGNGILPYTIDYATTFGHGPNNGCGWYLKAEKSGFVPVSQNTFCGTTIPGKSGKVAP